MAATAVTQAKAKLVDLLNARPNLGTVQVTYGYAVGDDEQLERVWMGRARGTHTPASLRTGRTFRDEAATFEVVVQVLRLGDDGQSAEDRCYEIGLEVEECVADNRSPADLCAASGFKFWVVEDFEVASFSNDVGTGAQLIYTVRFAARLT